MTAGSITITRDGLADLTLTRARVRSESITYDRAQFRAPYGAFWRTSGTRQRAPNRFTFVIEVHAASINQAAPVARDIVDAFNAASSIIVPFGVITPTGVESYSVAPIEAGYRLTVTIMNASTALGAPELPVEPPIGLPENLVTANGDPVTAGGEYVTHG